MSKYIIRIYRELDDSTPKMLSAMDAEHYATIIAYAVKRAHERGCRRITISSDQPMPDALLVARNVPNAP